MAHKHSARCPDVDVLDSSVGGIPGPEKVVLIRLYYLQVRIVIVTHYKTTLC
jgi:hypothetical protein